MHCINKIKSYINFHINNLKLSKYKIGFKLYSQVNNIVDVITMKNIDY